MGDQPAGGKPSYRAEGKVFGALQGSGGGQLQHYIGAVFRSRACAREFVKAGGASALDKACAHNAYYRIGAAAHTRLFNMIFVSRVKRVIFCDNSCNNQKITFSFPKE